MGTCLQERSALNPAAVRLLAGACVLAAMAAGGRRPILFLVSVAVLTVGGLADAFDGIVARVQGKSSRFGDFLDHFCDRVSDLVLVIGWLLVLSRSSDTQAGRAGQAMLGAMKSNRTAFRPLVREHEKEGDGILRRPPDP